MIKAEYIASLLRQSEKPDAVDPLVITPPPDLEKLEHSGSASVDLRLGTWFVTLAQARMTHLEINDQTPETSLTKSHYVPFGRQYLLHPRSFVLGVTLEWIRLPKNFGGYVTAKSSWGRRGLIIATATGVHPGFTGCLTLELSNVGEIPIAIKPGMTICQLFLHEVGGVVSDAIDKSRFVGTRKPTLGRVQQDELSRKLAAANTIVMP